MDLNHTRSFRGAAKIPETPIVHIIDMDTSGRDALALTISTAGYEPRFHASAEEFLAGPRLFATSCMLLDVNLPGTSGLQLQQRILDRTEMPIVFTSSRIDVHAVVQAMKAGALEFLCKPLAEDVLLAVLRHALECSRNALRHREQMDALRLRYESLSRREREVMNLVVAGKLNKQVGGDLGISEITVKAHRGKMMRKMQASSFAELVYMAADLRPRTFSLALQD